MSTLKKNTNDIYYDRISGDVYNTIGGSNWILYKAKLRGKRKKLENMTSQAEFSGDIKRAESCRKLNSKLSFTEDVCSTHTSQCSMSNIDNETSKTNIKTNNSKIYEKKKTEIKK